MVPGERRAAARLCCLSCRCSPHLPQASAYKSGEVVRTLKQVMMPKDEDGNLLASTTFKDQNAVLGHLWSNILEPTWKVGPAESQSWIS